MFNGNASTVGPFIDSSDGDRVCYGMLYKHDVKLVSKNMHSLAMKLTQLAQNDPSHVQKFTLTSKPVHILLSLPDGTEFGFLRHNMTEALESLLCESPAVQLEALGLTSHLCQQMSHATKPDEALVQVNINIYGPPGRANDIGETLSNQKLWLQKPDHLKANLPYHNPHTLAFPELQGELEEEDITRITSATTRPVVEEERLRNLVTSVHNSLSRANELEDEAGDQRLKTKLLKHQKGSLSFMLQRESGNIPDKYRLWQKGVVRGQETYIHRITKTQSLMRPEEVGGGVLADEMGMGKSLSTLALILQTLVVGHEWAEKRRAEEHSSGKARRHSHSTLVIVPSALLINNWMNEIQVHAGDVLTTVKYHGQTRPKHLDILEKSDVIITTYNTLAAEYAQKKSLLHKINWYRVVLDEAHIIRRPTTTFHRTCADLEARSRWCLTGTPIQNRLDDIGALFAFLGTEQFKSLTQFRRFISTPFDQGEGAVVRDRLVMLYDSLVLRRTKDILDLPRHVERTRELALTEAERRQYQRTMNILQRHMLAQVGRHPDDDAPTHFNPRLQKSFGRDGTSANTSSNASPNSKFGLFQTQLQLRILCNHGTFQRPFSWKKRDLKDEQAAGREAFAAELGLGSEIMCDACRQHRPILGSTHLGPGSCFVENCTHSLCSECLEDCSNMPGLEDTRHCPLCRRLGRGEAAAPAAMQAPLRTHDDGDAEMLDGQQPGEEAVADGEDPEENSHHKDYFNPTGYSTKMAQLVNDVKEGLESSKSIIFSCWTRTLDLIARHLRTERIVFLRIDGDCLLSKRQRIIDRFASDRGVQVLLMTTGTGAFGLNLTAANRIFLVEPQWNPSVENQAIARAIRIKQVKEVQVTRYVIKDTVEKEMRSQQIVKQLAASVGFKRDGAAA
ncbi:SNF2 family N-terminal domain-containing protein [Lasiosphaeria miniovina]|uniref:SNF2 family N-terminal domain-containing protein n=1 Tax=Lasiosphaeria miniovina TaxID=1954250 RepID=A0AA40A6B0_9PEZI|nr:SNF2 family N-terminal domain-containing protein [Lasiosphaeria miniovina]KAK0710005.1 SNF2 family N-terminal domain-containing protein [Lasiosphaeria miniovina]